MHFDLTGTSLEDQGQTVAKSLAFGARHVDVGQRPQEGMWCWPTPEGNWRRDARLRKRPDHVHNKHERAVDQGHASETATSGSIEQADRARDEIHSPQP